MKGKMTVSSKRLIQETSGYSTGKQDLDSGDRLRLNRHTAKRVQRSLKKKVRRKLNQMFPIDI